MDRGPRTRVRAAAWLLAWAGAASLPAGAQPAAVPTYAVMSMLADRITVVTWQPAVGSNRDANKRQEMPLADDAVEGVAAFAADEAIRRVQPGASTSLFTTRDARLAALQEKAADSTELPAELLEGVKSLVAKSGAQRLLVLSRLRADARIRTDDGPVGSGRLTGVGFYIDPVYDLVDRRSRHQATGFVAPYAYVKVNVYDLATLRPLGQASATATELVTAAQSESAVTAWQALSGPARFEALKSVLRTAVSDGVARALK